VTGGRPEGGGKKGKHGDWTRRTTELNNERKKPKNARKSAGTVALIVGSRTAQRKRQARNPLPQQEDDFRTAKPPYLKLKEEMWGRFEIHRAASRKGTSRSIWKQESGGNSRRREEVAKGVLIGEMASGLT